MKKILFVLFSFSSFICMAQDFSQLKSIPLNNSEDCKNAQPKVVECANYLLSQPAIEDLNSLNAAKFIMSWMEKTPDYTFELGGDVFTSVASDTNLVSRYLAAQSLVAINTVTINDQQEFKYEYISTFLSYCEKPENKVKLNSRLKKFIKAKNEGQLKEMIAKK